LKICPEIAEKLASRVDEKATTFTFLFFFNMATGLNFGGTGGG
jgi:hypothetical protein